MQTLSSDVGRPPVAIRPGLWLFAPSRDSQGGSAWWLELEAGGAGGGVLIDCPGYTEANLAFLQARVAGRIVLTSREGHGRCRRIQEALGWSVMVQEQEAYLLPGVQRLRTLHEQKGIQLRWLSSIGGET